MSVGVASRGANAAVAIFLVCAALVVIVGSGRATAEQRLSSSCIIAGAHRLTRPLRIYASCLGGGGDVSALPEGTDVVIDEYPASCPRSKVAVRFEGRWYYAAADLVRESLDGCSSSLEEARLDQAADVLARACLRGEMDACRALRQHEKRAAKAALESKSSAPDIQTNPEAEEEERSSSADVEKTDSLGGRVSEAAGGSEPVDEGEQAVELLASTEETTPPVPLITKTACALRSEASLYGQLLIRLEKGRRCEKIAQEPPYVRVICDRDEGWAIEDCFSPR